MKGQRDLYVCGTQALAFYLSPKAKRLDKAFEERISRSLQPGQLPNFSAFADNPMPRSACCPLPLQGCAPAISNSEARELRGFFGGALPLNVMVASKEERRNSTKTCSWVHPAAVPRESYIRIAKSLYLAIPELATLQAAQSYHELELVVLASMLCSFYVESAEVTGGLEPRRALSTPKSYGAFLASFDPDSPAPLGTNLLKKAMRSVVPNAASPAELQLALLLSLPKNAGGYGFPKPELNTKYGVGGSASLRPDLLWSKKHIAIEYQSNANHSSSAQLNRDRQRSNLFQSAGLTLFEASSRHLCGPSAMEEFACMVAAKLGARVDLSQQARSKRAELHARIERALDHFGKLWL
ncbi:MAG: hypothetical protein ACI36W_05350 [Coriobacteriales bacterium]